MIERMKNLGQRTFASLTIRNYRLYFLGHGISRLGGWMQTTALGWLVLELTGSPAQLGLVVALQYLPLLLFGLWGGTLVDRFDKRFLLYWTQSLFALVAVVISILVFTELVEVWMLYALTLTVGFLRVVDDPLRTTFVTELVGLAHVRNAVSLNNTENNVARIVGPAIAGSIIALFGTAFCFFLNALSFAAVLATLFAMDWRTVHGTGGKTRPLELREVFGYVRSEPLIRNVLVIVAFLGAFTFQFQTNLPIFATQVFDVDVLKFATFFSIYGIGSVAGGLFAASRSGTTQKELSILTFLFGISIVVTAMSPSYEIALVCIAVMGFFAINVSSLANAVIQATSAPEIRGRVTALWSTAWTGTSAIGAPFLGMIAEISGGRVSVLLSGVVALVCALFLAFTLTEKRVTIPIE